MPHSHSPDDRNADSTNAEAWQAEIDQALSRSDQAGADVDQTGSDADQTSATADQSAADRDQEASDRNLASGADPHDWAVTREIRQRSTQQRAATTRTRMDAASVRDEIARSRDLVAMARDDAADARDLEMAQREQADRDADAGSGAIGHVDEMLEGLRRAQEHRRLASEHRRLAAEDRRAAAADREHAAVERLRALTEREQLARELAIAETDALTGAVARAAGLRELDLTVERCQATGAALVVAYIDVIGLKRINDAEGHGAGDNLLKHVVRLCRTHLRSDDLVVRLGGDEFLCAIVALPEPFVRARFAAVALELAASPGASAIRTGFATLIAGEPAAEMIARADADLIRQKGNQAAGTAPAEADATARDAPPGGALG